MMAVADTPDLLEQLKECNQQVTCHRCCSWQSVVSAGRSTQCGHAVTYQRFVDEEGVTLCLQSQRCPPADVLPLLTAIFPCWHHPQLSQRMPNTASS
jgi:hypothetical protein